MRTLGKVVVAASVSAVLGLSLGGAWGQYRPPGGGMVGGGGTGYRPGGTGTNTMQTNPAITADREQVTQLTTSLRQAQSALDIAVGKASTDFRKTPEYVAAQKAVEAASGEVQKARDAVLARLKTDPNYMAASAREAAARAKVEQLRSNGTDRDAIEAQSLEALRLSAETSRMERDALEADVPYKDAVKQFADARATLKTLEDNFLASLKNDANISALTAKRDDAKAQLATAQEKLRQDSASSNSSRMGGPTTRGGGG